MRKIIAVIMLLLPLSPLVAQNISTEPTVESLTTEVVRLKAKLQLKDEQITILLRALKNGEAEDYARLSSPKLNFKDIDVVTPTKVVLKSEDLGAEAIAQIDAQSSINKTFEGPKTVELQPKPKPVIPQQRLQQAQIPAAQERRLTAPERVQQRKETPVEVEEEVEHNPLVEENPAEVPVIVEREKAPAAVRQQSSPDTRRHIGEIPKLEYMQPTKFRVSTLAPVYKQIGGEMYEEWSVGTTFTSNRHRGKWIMITGIITDKGWQRAPAILWIQESFISKVR